MLPPSSHGEPSYSLVPPKAVLSPTMNPQVGRALAGSVNYYILRIGFPYGNFQRNKNVYLSINNRDL